jgi:hypothetical protein
MKHGDLAAIRRALEALPERCRYHGDELVSKRPFWGDDSCCDTGKPSLYRRRALEALNRIGT